jgi:hypothetical protein
MLTQTATQYSTLYRTIQAQWQVALADGMGCHKSLLSSITAVNIQFTYGAVQASRHRYSPTYADVLDFAGTMAALTPTHLSDKAIGPKNIPVSTKIQANAHVCTVEVLCGLHCQTEGAGTASCCCSTYHCCLCWGNQCQV